MANNWDTHTHTHTHYRGIYYIPTHRENSSPDSVVVTQSTVKQHVIPILYKFFQNIEKETFSRVFYEVSITLILHPILIGSGGGVLQNQMDVL